jgi:hypothetical protein
VWRKDRTFYACGDIFVENPEMAEGRGGGKARKEVVHIRVCDYFPKRGISPGTEFLIAGKITTSLLFFQNTANIYRFSANGLHH